MLLKRSEVNPDKPRDDGRTPLWTAAYNGHAEVVKMLLQRTEVNPDKLHIDGRTPLWSAAYNGHAEVVKMLLERSEVSPDKLNKNSQTPLWRAACNGNAEVVKMLLERSEANPDKPDNDGRTPLWPAAYNGHAEAVKCYSNGARSTLANRMRMAKHYSSWPLNKVTPRWWRYYCPGFASMTQKLHYSSFYFYSLVVNLFSYLFIFSLI